jgi:acyl-CoA thioesterase
VTFAAATAVTDRGDGTFAAEIAEGWEIAGNANGGYLLAIAARAVTVATGRPDPVTITAHFLAPGRPGPATVAVDVLRAGGRHSTAQFVLATGDRPLLAGIATTTELHAHSGPIRVEVDPPDLLPPDECVLLVPGDPLPPPFVGRVEVRLHPDDAPFRGTPSGEARMRGWFRLRDGEQLDSIALVQAVDAFPPTSFNAQLPVSWTPTVELTAHVRRHACDGWLACAFSTHNIAGGYLETDGEIWDEAGSLVAQSRQLQLVPSP